MKVRVFTALVLLSATALVLVGCSANPTSTPAPAVPPPATVAPTNVLPTVSVTMAPPGGVDVAWLSVIQPTVDVVARVNGFDITKQAYLDELLQQLHAITVDYQVDWNDETMRSYLPDFQDEVLVGLTEEIMIRQIAALEGLTVDEAAVTAELESVRDEVIASGQFESWEQFIEVMGWTPQTLKDQLTTYLFFKQLGDIHGGPTTAEHVHAVHILVDTEETAKEVLAKLQAGEDFAALAAAYSTDTSNKDSGGDLGWFPRSAMVPEFEEAAFALEVGETSDIVATDYGFHIIRLLGKEVRELSAELLDISQQQGFQTWFDGVRETADVEILVQFAQPEPTPTPAS